MTPVLLVHGIADTSKNFLRMRRALEPRVGSSVHAIDLEPNDGRVGLATLAEQVDHAAQRLLSDTGAAKLDLVGFSMGTLVSRYWLQRLGGRERTRRFVSISGPHAGTWLAHLSGRPGIRDMRPGSPFLRELEADPVGFGDVDVHVLFTPLDLMIVPARSSMLEKAKSFRAIPVVLHPLMLSDRRVLDEVTRLLCDA